MRTRRKLNPHFLPTGQLVVSGRLKHVAVTLMAENAKLKAERDAYQGEVLRLQACINILAPIQ